MVNGFELDKRLTSTLRDLKGQVNNNNNNNNNNNKNNKNNNKKKKKGVVGSKDGRIKIRGVG